MNTNSGSDGFRWVRRILIGLMVMCAVVGVVAAHYNKLLTKYGTSQYGRAERSDGEGYVEYQGLTVGKVMRVVPVPVKPGSTNSVIGYLEVRMSQTEGGHEGIFTVFPASIKDRNAFTTNETVSVWKTYVIEPGGGHWVRFAARLGK